MKSLVLAVICLSAVVGLAVCSGPQKNKNGYWYTERPSPAVFLPWNYPKLLERGNCQMVRWTMYKIPDGAVEIPIGEMCVKDKGHKSPHKFE